MTEEPAVPDELAEEAPGDDDQSPVSGPFAYSNLGVTNEDDPALGFNYDPDPGYVDDSSDDAP